MSKKFLTADLHFGHANIAGSTTSKWKEGFRIFHSVEEMDEAILAGINSRVSEDDELYIIGDFAMGDRTKIPYYRNRIICKNVHLIEGNHDKNIQRYEDIFASISKAKTIFTNKEGIYLHHYACRVWEGSHKGYYHAYGHSHGSLEHTPHGRSMDVGIDNAWKILGQYRPFSITEFFNLLSKRPIELLDHHSPETNIK